GREVVHPGQAHHLPPGMLVGGGLLGLGPLDLLDPGPQHPPGQRPGRLPDAGQAVTRLRDDVRDRAHATALPLLWTLRPLGLPAIFYPQKPPPPRRRRRRATVPPWPTARTPPTRVGNRPGSTPRCRTRPGSGTTGSAARTTTRSTGWPGTSTGRSTPRSSTWPAPRASSWPGPSGTWPARPGSASSWTSAPACRPSTTPTRAPSGWPPTSGSCTSTTTRWS